MGLPQILGAIEQQDRELFDQHFKGLQGLCNSCHVNEKMGFVEVVIPTQRLSSVHFKSRD